MYIHWVNITCDVGEHVPICEFPFVSFSALQCTANMNHSQNSKSASPFLVVWIGGLKVWGFHLRTKGSNTNPNQSKPPGSYSANEHAQKKAHFPKEDFSANEGLLAVKSICRCLIPYNHQGLKSPSPESNWQVKTTQHGFLVENGTIQPAPAVHIHILVSNSVPYQNHQGVTSHQRPPLDPLDRSLSLGLSMVTRRQRRV